MIKRLLAGALCMLAALMACVPAQAVNAPVNLHDDSVVRKRSTVIYCMSDDRYRLVPEVRDVSILSNETLLDVLVEEVLKPAEGENLVSALPDPMSMVVLSVAQTGRVATVDLCGDVELMQSYDIFCLKAALANTLIESGDVDYVNVLFNGMEVPTNGLPTGTLTRFSEDLQSEWVAHENEGVAALRSQSYSFRRNVTLFFPANDSNYLLAEVRQIDLTRSNLASPIIEALISGPSSTTSMRRCYPSATKIDGIPFFEEDGSSQYLDVSFTYELGTALSGDDQERRQQLAPLVMTLTTFLPQTTAVRVRINRRPIESLFSGPDIERLLYRERYAGLLGRTVELYFPKEDGRLCCVERAILQTESTLRDLTEQLLTVPQDQEVLPVFPEGFNETHLRGVTMVDDMAVVNLTADGAELMRGLTPDEERAAIFCIVNTLTGWPGVNRVQFLVEGCKVDELAGALNLRSPLIRNPGIIQTSLN